jgi:hypothetical protein
MTKKNIQCILTGLGRTMMLPAQGRHGFDDVKGSGRRGLTEDDSIACPGTARIENDVGSTASQARGG